MRLSQVISKTDCEEANVTRPSLIESLTERDTSMEVDLEPGARDDEGLRQLSAEWRSFLGLNLHSVSKLFNIIMK